MAEDERLFDRETILDLTVNVIPLGILVVFMGIFLVLSPFGFDSVISSIQFGIIIGMFFGLVVLTYYSGKAISKAEKNADAEAEAGAIEPADTGGVEPSDGGDRPTDVDTTE